MSLVYATVLSLLQIEGGSVCMNWFVSMVTRTRWDYLPMSCGIGFIPMDVISEPQAKS